VSPTDELARSCLDLRWHLDPAAASRMGVHEQDHRLGQFDAASVREHLAAFRSLEAAAEALEVEGTDEEIDRTALLGELRVAIFRLQHERAGARNPALWIGHLADALGDRVVGWSDGQALLARFRAVPAFLHSAEASLTEPSEPMVDLACELIEPVADLVTRRLAEHADDPELYPQLKDAGMSAESALARFRLALDTELRELSATHAPGVGETQFERLLHHGHAVRGGAPELWRQFLRLEEETLEGMHRLARDLDGDWRALLEERLEGTELELDPATEALRELRRIQAFLADRDILPVETGELSLDPVPGWQVPCTWPAAYVPPPAAGDGPARLLLTDSRWVRALLPPIVAELGIPGLHLQTVVARRLPNEVRRFWPSLLSGGWGLYALELLESEGYWSTPGERLVVRAHQLFRLVLARVDIGVHTRQMTMEEGASALVDRLPIDPVEAQAAVRGVLLAPAQAAGAVSTWKELERLRADREAAERPRFSLRGFHERVLKCGGLPVPLVRWAMES